MAVLKLRNRTALPASQHWATVTTVSPGSVRAFSCWADQFVAAKPEGHLHVNVLDESAFDHVRAWMFAHGKNQSAWKLYNGPAEAARHDEAYSFWWLMKSKMASSAGGVLHASSDTFFLKNPDSLIWRILNSHPHADIVAMHDAASDAHGAYVLNMGFVLFRKTQSVLKLIDEMLEHGYSRESLNHVLDSKGCQWTLDVNATGRDYAAGSCGGVHVVLISDDFASQSLEGAGASSRAVVLQPPLHQDDKIRQLKALELCSLEPADWTTMVMFDSAYLREFDCWASRFLSSNSKSPLRLNLLDADAKKFVEQWVKAREEKLTNVRLSFGRWDWPRGQPGKDSDMRSAPLRSSLERREETAWPPASYMQAFWPAVKADMMASTGGVLHVDSDAMYIKDPDKLLGRVIAEYPDADIISSRGAVEPEKVSESWGFVLNTGFILFRKTPAVLRLIDFMQEKPNDQQALNFYLYSRNCTWEVNADASSRISAVGRCGATRVVVISKTYVNRLDGPVEDDDPIVIRHPWLRWHDKMHQLRNASLC